MILIVIRGKNPKENSERLSLTFQDKRPWRLISWWWCLRLWCHAWYPCCAYSNQLFSSVFHVFLSSNETFRTQLKLETLDDAVVLSDADDDLLEDRHGCPVYASPEILSSQPSSKYSGRAAGSWSLGVLLYTMLVGRYPFSDANPVSLLNKIRRCQFSIPSSISPTTRLVISSLLQKDPQDRMTTEELLDSKLFSKDFLEDLKEIRQSC